MISRVRMPARIAAVLLWAMLFPSGLSAQDRASSSRWKKAWRWSAQMMIAAQAADTASSWGAMEANPMLGRGATFGPKSTAIKAGTITAFLLVSHRMMRNKPDSDWRKATFTNWAIAGGTTALAVRNWRVR